MGALTNTNTTNIAMFLIDLFKELALLAELISARYRLRRHNSGINCR
jgi:hypothetical protein